MTLLTNADSRFTIKTTQMDKNEQASAPSGGQREQDPQVRQQEQSDPQLTELRGFTDSDEKLEPEGTDNPVQDIPANE